eukprot:SAG31_NODE_1779_length_7293_cov_39.850153_3_plen_213_part_00
MLHIVCPTVAICADDRAVGPGGAAARVSKINTQHQVWVPSQFNMETFERSGVKEDKLSVGFSHIAASKAFWYQLLLLVNLIYQICCQVVPEPIDTDFFDPIASGPLDAAVGPDRTSGEILRLGKGTADRFTFLSVFAWTDRKGWDTLLEAYWQEFRADEPVRYNINRFRSKVSDGSVRHVFKTLCGAGSVVTTNVSKVQAGPTYRKICLLGR